ncbi:MAG: YdcF family protein [Bacteroidia bacterium]|nr:YdcF family protein [Bacteroidia bacterium]MDW8333533.1 YdcF family protein [Bacteroidia bacterium]
MRFWIWTLTTTVGAVALAWFNRTRLLRAAGEYLDASSAPERCEALFVLAGAPMDRGEYAARLFALGVAPTVVCTGQLPHATVQKICGLDYTEAHSTRHVLLDCGVRPEAVRILGVGTSTREECRAVVEYARKNGWKKVGVVSSLFHTRRIARTIEPLAQAAGLQVKIFGAPSLEFDERYWWRYENGLIFVNNEYVKLIYYAIGERL